MTLLRFVPAVVLLAGLTADGHAAELPPQAPLPCAGCVVLSLHPAAAAALLGTPALLDGVHVLLRLSVADATAIPTLLALRARGAHPGIELPESLAGDVAADLARAAERVLLIVDRAASIDPARQSFALKQRVTAIRALAPSTDIGIDVEASLPTADALSKLLAPYVDFIVDSHVRMAPATGETIFPPVWGRYVSHDRSSVEAAVAAARQGARVVIAYGADATGLETLVGALAFSGTNPWSGGAATAGGQDGDRFSTEIQVTAARSLTVDEIVARHQAAAARQAAIVSTVMASGTSVLTLDVPGVSAPFTITAETVLFRTGDLTELEQRSIRLNGLDVVATTRSGVPRLPLIEPERVNAAPLAIALTEAYEYRLEGVEDVGGHACYVVRFTPARSGMTLFRGRAWIAVDSFGMVQVAAEQTDLRGPIVSSAQRDIFVPVAAGPAGTPPVWLLSRSEVHQVYEGAGFRTPLHRVLTLGNHEVNRPDFEARRLAAHASSATILRDGPSGWAYLERKAPGRGEPALRQRTTTARRVRTLAFGVIVDPNITRPLPFAGVSYVDVNFLGTGAQVNGFFGGAYGQIAWAVPAIGGTKWRATGAAFATVAEFNDRVFRDGLERYAENIQQRPAFGSIAFLHPLSPWLSLRLGYEADYKRLRAADTTASAFQVPVSPLVHAARVGLDAQRRGWTVQAWWNPGIRQRWERWGRRDEGLEPVRRAFHRYGLSAARSVVFGPALVARMEASWVDGRDLDRFSRYTIGTFDNRLHGYPGASLRYDRGLVARSAVSWTAAPWLRLNGFLDGATVADRGTRPGYSRHAGLGAGAEIPGPFGTLVSVEAGYGAQARDPRGGSGTRTVQIAAYRIF